MHVAACPPNVDLEGLFLGGLPEKELEDIERHVLECSSCLSQLKKQLYTKETLSSALRDETQTDAPAATPVVEDLMKRLESLPALSKAFPPQAAPQVTRSSAPSGQSAVTQALHSSDTDLEASLIDFLAPPQSNDELGRLGKYRILKVIGHGGMGVVFQAEDPQLKRSVALKAMLPALAASASARQRFLREAQAMAAIEHDHIVRIYQVDEERGIPFLAMEFLRGESLEERLKREEKLPVAEVLRIGRETAEALAAAHATGLIHRDIKPGNIWLEAPQFVASHGMTKEAARVKILDFGLARAASQDGSLTQQGAVMGTPAYMAPEQARGDVVDARCDLFSLGVLLYRLCTGAQPFRGSDAISTLMSVCNDEPVPLLSVNADLPKALSDLVMKLLAKDPSRRIGSAAEVVREMRRLERDTALSSPDLTAVIRDRELDRGSAAPAPRRGRRRLVAWAAVLLGVLGLGGLAAAVVVYRIQTDHGELVISTDNPDVEVMVRQAGKVVTILDTKTGKQFTLHSGVYDLELKGQKDGAKLEPGQVTIRRGDTVLATITQTKKAFAGQAKPELLYRLPWMDEQQRFPAHLWYTQISPDGRLFLAGGDTGPAGAIRICSLATGRQVQVLVLGGDPWYYSAKFLPDGKHVVASYNKMKDLYLWDIDSGRVIRKFVGHDEPGPDFAIAPDGKRILSWSADKTVRLWNVVTGKEVRKLEGQADAAAGVFSPDGKQVLTFNSDNTLRLLSVETGVELKKLEGHMELPTGCFSPDGKQVLSYAADQTIRLWDLGTGKEIRRYEGPAAKVISAGFVADGRLVVANTGDLKFLAWDAASGKLACEIDDAKLGNRGWNITASPDGRLALAGHDHLPVRVFELPGGKEIYRFTDCQYARGFTFSPDGTMAVAGSFRSGVFVFRLPLRAQQAAPLERR